MKFSNTGNEASLPMRLSLGGKLNLFDDVKFLNKDNNQPNIYCSNKNISDNEIVFNGHSDVVPVTKEQDKMWNLGTPWGGDEIDNKIYDDCLLIFSCKLFNTRSLNN